MSIPGKPVQVPKGYPKNAPNRLVLDQMFIDGLSKHMEKTLFEDCVRNTNPGAKPKSLDTESDLIYNGAFCDYLWWVHIL